MKEEELGWLVVWSIEDVRYISNYNPILNEFALVVPRSGEPVLFIDDEDDLIRARAVTKLAKVVVTSSLGKSVAELIRQHRATEGGTIGVSGWNRFPVPAYLEIKKLTVPMRQAKLVEELRQVKSANEIEMLKEAGRLSDIGMVAAVEAAMRGKSELEMAGSAEGAMRAAGAEALSFPSNIGVGGRTNLMAPMPSSARPKNGDLVLIDLGARYEGYCGDTTRTKTVGRPSKGQRQLFEAVAEIHRKAVEAVRPGVRTSRVHEVAKETAQELGYGEYYRYLTGHSIGLGEHERPFLYHDGDVLKERMVVTIEPQVYTPKVGGIRIEDVVLVTSTGRKLLTSSDRAFE